MRRRNDGRYNGSASITFTVYRVFDNGKDRPPTVEEMESGENLEEVELEIFGSSYYVPACTSGPADNWCPSEGEAEISEIRLGTKEWDGELTSKEECEVLSLLDDGVRSNRTYEDDAYEAYLEDYDKDRRLGCF